MDLALGGRRAAAAPSVEEPPFHSAPQASAAAASTPVGLRDIGADQGLRRTLIFSGILGERPRGGGTVARGSARICSSQ